MMMEYYGMRKSGADIDFVVSARCWTVIFSVRARAALVIAVVRNRKLPGNRFPAVFSDFFIL